MYYAQLLENPIDALLVHYALNVFTISLTNHFGLMIISVAATAACFAERPIINLITDATPACTLRMQSRVA
jgi:hypothetical protein